MNEQNRVTAEEVQKIVREAIRWSHPGWSFTADLEYCEGMADGLNSRFESQTPAAVDVLEVTADWCREHIGKPCCTRQGFDNGKCAETINAHARKAAEAAVADEKHTNERLHRIIYDMEQQLAGRPPLRPVPGPPETKTFGDELERLINCYSMENGSDTPDFMLAGFLCDCLAAFDKATNLRSEWYGSSTIASPETELPRCPCGERVGAVEVACGDWQWRCRDCGRCGPWMATEAEALAAAGGKAES